MRSRVDTPVVTALPLALSGLAIGLAYGVFGAGGSAFATPALVLLGASPLAAVASPLPFMLPAALGSSRQHLRNGSLDRRVALLVICGGLPTTILGSLLSSQVPGHDLLIGSGVVLGAVGLRIAFDRSRPGSRRAMSTPAMVAAGAAIGLLTGLLANGGGFLLVPFFVVGLGMTSHEAAGTSMVAASALTIPSLITHAALGHIDWAIALAFGVGMFPGTLIGTSLGHRIPTAVAKPAFGLLLAGFASYFLVRAV